ncbi:Riboflavin synthase eubacterial/eukaryotic [Rhodopirellula islandica]|uniref:Riboflavin synthase n=1 Tax=Rhodopirellula islandica TaxID=595434 RepID=A0A0J1BHV1_RHOIS|nr:riboflavin synthase [Rhodopirellula islandica]KLU06126.1 Riboflavin synthase eubacterial/eukaryotic [Rhodopirellula islandica]
MFTGLVESVGQLSAVVEQPPGRRLVIAAPSFRDEDPAQDVKLGDSIAINGCCLTVIEIDGNDLAFEAGEETLHRTNLGELTAGSTVNLERSLAVGDRMGGHYVTGHIDCVGQLIERVDDPPWANLKFSVPPPYSQQIVSKGSIAIDGISLTVVDVGEDHFTVALIPHTLDVTTLGGRQVGDRINLETDLLAKYVQRTLQFGNANDQPSADTVASPPNTPWSPQS